MSSSQQPPSNPKSDNEAKEYVDRILKRIYEERNWAVADIMLQNCPKTILKDVGFILLHHILIDTSDTRWTH